MQKPYTRYLLGPTLLLLLVLLTACGPSTGGATTGTGTRTPTATPTATPSPTAMPSPTATPSPALTPTPVAPGLGRTYTFVRANQLWVALNGAAPVQATHFAIGPASQTYVAYGQPLWFDHNRSIAFTFRMIIDGGLGGGGCGFTSNYGRTGGLYIVDTSTMKVSQIMIAGDPSTSNNYVLGGFFEFLFPEDATHLLAWHGIGESGNNPMLTTRDGLYRYDLTSGSLTQLLQASKLPGIDNMESWAPIRYNNGQLYYEAMTSIDTHNTYNYTIYRHTITNADAASVKVLNVGNEPFCAQTSNSSFSLGPFTGPGFDISPDGKYLVAQTLTGSDPQHRIGQVQMVALDGGAVTPLFQQVPSQFLSQDADLAWSPDSSSVLLSEVVLQQNSSTLLKLYSTSITNAASVQEYSTGGTGSYYPHIARTLWHESSAGFTLWGYNQGGATPPTDAYIYMRGQAQPQVILKDARNFVWGENGDA